MLNSYGDSSSAIWQRYLGTAPMGWLRQECTNCRKMLTNSVGGPSGTSSVSSDSSRSHPYSAKLFRAMNARLTSDAAIEFPPRPRVDGFERSLIRELSIIGSECRALKPSRQ